MGNIYERGGQQEKADKEYRKSIEKLTPDQNMISQIAGSFGQLNKIDLAIETYLKGKKLRKFLTCTPIIWRTCTEEKETFLI